MSRLVPLTKVVIAGNKGGTGKTTIAALLTEYLTYQGKRVNLIDTDPNQVLYLTEDMVGPPYDADNLDTRGFANMKLGQFDRAIADYSDALDSDPKLATSIYGRGIARLKKGDRRGSADIASAQAIKSDIAEEFTRYGLRP